MRHRPTAHTLQRSQSDFAYVSHVVIDNNNNVIKISYNAYAIITSSHIHSEVSVLFLPHVVFGTIIITCSLCRQQCRQIYAFVTICSRSRADGKMCAHSALNIACARSVTEQTKGRICYPIGVRVVEEKAAVPTA